MEEDKYIADQTVVNVALALGGGGVRGLAHIGVLRALSKDIPINMIAGTSMGAVVGALYALNPDIEAVEQKIREALEKKGLKEIEKLIGDTPLEEKKLIMESLFIFMRNIYLLNLRAIKRWLFSGKEISEIFDFFGFDTDFKNLKIPFCCVSVDLRSGEIIVINKGNLKEAILSSIALPAVFPPVKKGNRLLVDGGVVCSVPVDAARQMGADLVIGVGVEAQVDYQKKLGNGLDMMFQVDMIRAYQLSEFVLNSADFVIYPKVGSISWANFSKASECILAGEKAMDKAKEEIKELIRKKRREKFWKEFFSLPKY